jgi:PIN domain nuclease of toxin-antitoxin system
VRLLLDTHAMLWALLRPRELAKNAANALRAAENEVFVSAASAWEVAIKSAAGKLRLPGVPEDWLPGALRVTGFESLDIRIEHALAAGALPDLHRDPFDRLLVAQALAEGLVVVTRDPRIAAYGAPVLPA